MKQYFKLRMLLLSLGLFSASSFARAPCDLELIGRGALIRVTISQAYLGMRDYRFGGVYLGAADQAHVSLSGHMTKVDRIRPEKTREVKVGDLLILSYQNPKFGILPGVPQGLIISGVVRAYNHQTVTINTTEIATNSVYNFDVVESGSLVTARLVQPKNAFQRGFSPQIVTGILEIDPLSTGLVITQVNPSRTDVHFTAENIGELRLLSDPPPEGDGNAPI